MFWCLGVDTFLGIFESAHGALLLVAAMVANIDGGDSSAVLPHHIVLHGFVKKSNK